MSVYPVRDLRCPFFGMVSCRVLRGGCVLSILSISDGQGDKSERRPSYFRARKEQFRGGEGHYYAGRFYSQVFCRRLFITLYVQFIRASCKECGFPVCPAQLRKSRGGKGHRRSKNPFRVNQQAEERRRSDFR